jgi:predicted metal-dependent phosphoesterase TrpH
VTHDAAATGRVDLHVHTTASDGLFSPAKVVAQAADAGLAAIAITDHDTVSGLAEAASRGGELGIEVVPGVELTSYAGGTEVHVLGLFVDTTRANAIARVDTIRNARRGRMEEMVRLLAREGVDVSIDEVFAESGDGAVGRPHLARVLARHGHVEDENEAFYTYLRPGRPAYVRKYELSPEEAIALVRDLGGLPVYAHPGVSRLDERLGELKAAGLAALEVWHPKHKDADVAHYLKLARKRGLVPSGGSDYHGAGRSEACLGSQPVTRQTLEQLRNAHLAASATGAKT